MQKHYFLEQLKRSKFITEDEMKDMSWNPCIIYHDRGHLLLNLLMSEEIIADNDQIDIKKHKKFLNRKIKQYNKVTDRLDAKYNYFENDEIMLKRDEKKYFLADGVVCEALLYLSILNKKRYLNKSSYE